MAFDRLYENLEYLSNENISNREMFSFKVVLKAESFPDLKNVIENCSNVDVQKLAINKMDNDAFIVQKYLMNLAISDNRHPEVRGEAIKFLCQKSERLKDSNFREWLKHIVTDNNENYDFEFGKIAIFYLCKDKEETNEPEFQDWLKEVSFSSLMKQKYFVSRTSFQMINDEDWLKQQIDDEKINNIYVFSGIMESIQDECWLAKKENDYKDKNKFLSFYFNRRLKRLRKINQTKASLKNDKKLFCGLKLVAV